MGQGWQALASPEGVLEKASRVRQVDKIRYLLSAIWGGATSHSLPMDLRLMRSGLFDIIQFPFTVIKEETANEFVPLAAALGQGIIVMKPFAGGVLTMLPWRSTSFH